MKALFSIHNLMKIKAKDSPIVAERKNKTS